MVRRLRKRCPGRRFVPQLEAVEEKVLPSSAAAAAVGGGMPAPIVQMLPAAAAVAGPAGTTAPANTITRPMTGNLGFGSVPPAFGNPGFTGAGAGSVLGTGSSVTTTGVVPGSVGLAMGAPTIADATDASFNDFPEPAIAPGVNGVDVAAAIAAGTPGVGQDPVPRPVTAVTGVGTVGLGAAGAGTAAIGTETILGTSTTGA